MNCEVVKETYRAERQSYKLALKANDTCQIEWFSFPDPVKRPSHPEACGLRQLAFEVDDVDEAVGILSEKGAEPESVRIDELTGKRFTFFSDPDVLP